MPSRISRSHHRRGKGHRRIERRGDDETSIKHNICIVVILSTHQISNRPFSGLMLLLPITSTEKSLSSAVFSPSQCVNSKFSFSVSHLARQSHTSHQEEEKVKLDFEKI